jgi:hypothetical protein
LTKTKTLKTKTNIKTNTSKPKPMSKPILQNQNHIKTKAIKTKSFGFGACLYEIVFDGGFKESFKSPDRNVRKS